MISFFIGTRPEIVKMSSLISLALKRGLDFVIIHTNQHFSPNMDKQFFDDLKLPDPDFNLNVHERSHSGMVSEIICKSEKIFLKVKPNIVLVQGDTNSVLAGSIVASKMNIPIGHVEAGLRSYDENMPEEINRKVTDHLSKLLFCPTKVQAKILLSEGIDKKKIFVTGNTIVDAVVRNLNLVKRNDKQIKINGEYALLTLHRPSNVDNAEVLKKILDSIEKLGKALNLRIFFPIHPRTKYQIKKFKIRIDTNVYIQSEPIGYLEMLALEKNSKLILTDSGGIQEEACILNKPCVTIRENTERPETVFVGANVVAGVNGDKIIESAQKMVNIRRNWTNPFGDGHASEKILDILENAGLF